MNLALLKSSSVVGVNYTEFFQNDRAGVEDNLAALMQLFEAGRINPVVDAIYPLEQGATALNHLAERRAVGKVVVKVAG